MGIGFVGVGALPLKSGSRTCVSRRTRRSPMMMAQGGGDANKPFGMFGQMGKIMDAYKKAQEFTKETKIMQEELAATELEGTARDGLVKVVMTGNQVPLSVEVSEELLGEGSEAVSEACTEAFKEAHRISVAHMQTNLSNLTASFGLPANIGEGPGAPPGGPQ
ncbi:hypothetical protein NDN08_005120 [Rhodosorus marinus]|uniref:Nucleoid-associated protein n=1 Tax=Rhodosorus marinus TaxID=101924 RepID=A0AAV8V4Y3_9RHOD|nr:hypothetical protein NDN08_005120 [Rhodosorus marinus]